MTTSRLRSLASTALASALLLSLNACAVDADPQFGSDSEALEGVDPSEPVELCELGTIERCTQENGEGGQTECIVDENNELAWSTCEVPECDGWNGVCCTYEIMPNVTCCADEPCNTPLVLSFDNQPVAYHQGTDVSSFSLTAQASSQITDWPTAATPWLAIDANDNGRIDDASELFGDATPLSTTRGKHFAKNGFEALAQHDTDGDGFITPSDASWRKLVVWADDGDRSSQARELTLASKRELLWIALDYHVASQCDARGNCEGERASFAYLDATGTPQMGTIVDIRLPNQN